MGAGDVVYRRIPDRGIGALPRFHVVLGYTGLIGFRLLLGLGTLAWVSRVLLFQDIGGDALEELHEGVSNAMLLTVLIHIAGGE